MADFISIFDDKPKERGWYATLHCWDVGEGFFPDSVYWDGEFKTTLPVSHFIKRKFETKEKAEEVAWKNDPNW